MDVKYRRLSPDDDDVVEVFGYRFVEGKTVPVDDKYAAKMRGNPCFEVVGEQTYGDAPVDLASRTRVEDGERAARAALALEGHEETQKANQAEAMAAKRGPGRPKGH
jgi:hypothetical protein